MVYTEFRRDSIFYKGERFADTMLTITVIDTLKQFSYFFCFIPAYCILTADFAVGISY